MEIQPGIDVRNCDNLDELSGIPSLPERSVHVTVTSPPYNQLGNRIPKKPSGFRKKFFWMGIKG